MNAWFSQKGMLKCSAPPDDLEGKVCTGCGEFKSLDEFGNDKKARDGKNFRCKECAKEATKKYQKNNIVKEKLRCKKYREDNREKCNERCKKWRKENPGKIEDYKEKQYKNNSKYKKTGKGKLCMAKSVAKRNRDLGYIPLNDCFNGCEGHHINKLYVIFIPVEMHRNVRHKMGDVESMSRINELAIGFLNEQREQRL